MQVYCSGAHLCVGLRREVLTARAKYWESCSYALNPQWASSYEPGTFYCTADEGFTFDGGLHWIRPLRMFLGEVGAVAATTGRALKHMKGASLASAIFEFESGVSAVRTVPFRVLVLHQD